jgi:hypothetical protein
MPVSFILDCAPHGQRPDYYFDQLCLIELIREGWFVKKSAFFGEWAWEVKPQYESEYNANRSKIGEYLFVLHKQGLIRYAEF